MNDINSQPSPLSVSGAVFNVQRFSTRDGPGLRTTVFLKGCPLVCSWCHNPESQSSEVEIVFRENRCLGCGACVAACPQGRLGPSGDPNAPCLLCARCAEVCPAEARQAIGRIMTAAEVLAEVLKDRSFYEESGGGVTFSGGEPLAQPGFLQALLRACRAEDLHTAVDTSGSAPWEVLESILPRVDLFLYDLKLMDERRHFLEAGVTNALILDNLRRLDRAGAAAIIRLPIVPGINDDDDNIEALGEFVADLKTIRYIVLLPYHETGIEKYRLLGRESRAAASRPPSRERLIEIARRLEGYGLTVTLEG